MTLAQMVEMEARLHEIAAEQLRTTGGRRVLWWTPGQTTIDGFRALLSERFPPERVAAEVTRVERAA